MRTMKRRKPVTTFAKPLPFLRNEARNCGVPDLRAVLRKEKERR